MNDVINKYQYNFIDSGSHKNNYAVQYMLSNTFSFAALPANTSDKPDCG